MSKTYDIINVDRAALGRVAGAIAKQHGDHGYTGAVNLTLNGSGGQSFGCFLVKVSGRAGSKKLLGAMGEKRVVRRRCCAAAR